jgi:malate dehydrogenase
MGRMLTASDVEAAAKAGHGLAMASGDRLTPLARDRAKELGVALLTGDAPRAAVAPATAPASALSASAAPKPAAGATLTAPPSSGRAFVLPPSGAMYRRNALGPQAQGGAARDARPKAGVVGAGHVGAMTALRLAESDLFSQVTLVDVVPGLAAGLALDMWHGAGLYRFSTHLAGNDDLAALAGAEYIVITAGKPRQPGMSRTDLTAVNAAIIDVVGQGIRQHAPNATLVVVSNPLEEMTHRTAQVTGFAEERVLGMAGVLDSARFCSLVGLAAKARPQQVRALALGSHGPEMVIPLSQAFIDATPIETVLDAQTLNAIVERTRESGGEVVKLLQKGSAYFSPAESAAAMVRAMVRDDGEVLAACVRSRGAYGTVDTRVGLPVRLHRRGLKDIVTLALRPAEQQALKEAAARIAARIDELAAPR